MAERVGFEPTCPLLAGKTLSRRPRYDHFGTSPKIVHSPQSKVEEFKSRMTAFSLTSIFYFRLFDCFSDFRLLALFPRKNSFITEAQSVAMTPLTTSTL